jgi:hypothetical protein
VAVPDFTTYFTVADPVEPPARVTLSVMEATVSGMLNVLFEKRNAPCTLDEVEELLEVLELEVEVDELLLDEDELEDRLELELLTLPVRSSRKRFIITAT